MRANTATRSPERERPAEILKDLEKLGVKPEDLEALPYEKEMKLYGILREVESRRCRLATRAR